MNEQEALQRMVAPGQHRPGKWRGGVIQIHLTRACDKACYGCTQGSNLRGKTYFMTPEQFEQACLSLKGYFGVVGVFGGNPATHPQFDKICAVMRQHIPHQQRGLWCNNPLGWGKEMRATFNPRVSNLNVHMDRKAYDEFKRDWPESMPFGLDKDSRHSPPYVAMRDLTLLPANPGGDKEWVTMVNTEENRWELISRCDINQHWSAMIGVFRGELRAWFCEIAGAQSILHQDDPDYPDTGLRILENGDYVWEGTKFWDKWWQLPMSAFAHQVRKHCHECGVPLKGYGALAVSDPDAIEQVSVTHVDIYRPKRKGRAVEIVTKLEQLGVGRLDKFTHYLQNSGR